MDSACDDRPKRFEHRNERTVNETKLHFTAKTTTSRSLGTERAGYHCVAKRNKSLELDLGAEELHELAAAGGIAGPGGRGHEVAIDDGLVCRNLLVGAAGKIDIGTHGGIGRGGVALEHAGGGEDLRAVADRGDGLAVGEELAHDLEHARIEADVLRSAPAGDVEAGVVLGIDSIEISREGEVVPAELGIGLLAEEVVDGGRDGIAGLLLRADGVDLVTEHRERLERHHGLVVLGEVAAEQQNLRHAISPFGFPGGNHFPRRFHCCSNGARGQSVFD